jgi:hypothetical protein
MEDRAATPSPELVHGQPPASLRERGSDRAGTRPVGLDDPRALTILTTEHWSLLTQRSLVYNEAFSRAGMFLTFLSASMVALALVSQAMGFKGEFLLFATIVIAFDLFIGLATLGRIASASNEDLRTIGGMNRLRNAYLTMVPSLESYFITGKYDDIYGILAAYGEPMPQERTFRASSFVYKLDSILHGLTTTAGMVGTIVAILAGILAGLVAVQLGAPGMAAVAIGIAGGVILFAIETMANVRAFARFDEELSVRFPTPKP